MFTQFTHFANLKLTFWWFDSIGQQGNWEYADIRQWEYTDKMFCECSEYATDTFQWC